MPFSLFTNKYQQIGSVSDHLCHCYLICIHFKVKVADSSFDFEISTNLASVEVAFRFQFPGGDKTAFQLLANVDQNPKIKQNWRFQGKILIMSKPLKRGVQIYCLQILSISNVFWGY